MLINDNGDFVIVEQNQAYCIKKIDSTHCYISHGMEHIESPMNIYHVKQLDFSDVNKEAIKVFLKK